MALSPPSLDSLLFNLEPLKENVRVAELVNGYLDGEFKTVLKSEKAKALYRVLEQEVGKSLGNRRTDFGGNFGEEHDEVVEVLIIGLAALNAFLQANVTGPPTDWDIFTTTAQDESENAEGRESKNGFRENCLRSLDVDGVSVYQHIPYVELFCLARLVFTSFFPRLDKTGEIRDCRWMRVRINAYHQRLLSGLSGGRLSDSTMLQDVIESDLKELEKEVLGEGFSTEAKVMFLLEKAQIYIMQGLDLKAKENVEKARSVSGFEYALSGALGKRTKFQQSDISQLVVFARSQEEEVEGLAVGLNGTKIENGGNAPKALDLNDDTLLEDIAFTKSDKIDNSALPPALKDMQPDEQPQLKPLDQITLLTEATLKDNFSPLDKLNREEILPYAVRVLSDKPTNWQIYTQALLVRSRIESHRSRTQERSVLQLQVIVDQIIADTQEAASSSENGVPEIRITQFLPRAKASESAPVQERLRYIYPLNTPTRWEIETELAYAWSGAGSLVSALEIFKRLKLWAEVALCYHSVGQEDKARQVVRRQLYFSSKGLEMDKYDIDAVEIVAEKWDGGMRPTPAHAPRLWCILGDLDSDPECWLRAWEISKHRYARAQRTLGEYYTKKGDLAQAREAYMKATIVNRQNNDTWSRLGDIDLAVGNWDGAVIAFQQSIMIDDTDAKTYSNLGSALLSKHAEMISLQKNAVKNIVEELQDEEEEVTAVRERPVNPKDILRQALQAYKRGASLAHSNWQIWDNVITIAGRMSPPSYPDLLLGLRAVIRIRSPTIGENAIDIDILRALIQEVITRDRKDSPMYLDPNTGIYLPPRGSLERAVAQVMDEEIVPLITKRWEIWLLVEKLSLWKLDFRYALACAERAWRGVKEGEEWLSEREKWKEVVSVTDNLVSAYENYGGREQMVEGREELVEKGWKLKARSAVRGVMAMGRDAWEGSEEWVTLEELLAGLKG